MNRVKTSGASQVVLVLAPVGRDADVAVSVLRTAGMVAKSCRNVSELNAFLRAEGNSVGALLLTEESLPSSMEYSGVAEWINHQEPWSDLPIIFLTHPGKPTRITGQRSRVLSLRGAVTVLERPVRRARWSVRCVWRCNRASANISSAIYWNLSVVRPSNCKMLGLRPKLLIERRTSF